MDRITPMVKLDLKLQRQSQVSLITEIYTHL